MFTLPAGFVTVKDAFDTVGSDKQCNVIAVVVDHLGMTKSRIDWMVKVTLYDHSGFPGLGAPFRFFNPDEAKLPLIGSNGNVLIIRNMKVKDFGGVAGLTNSMTEWTVIDGSSLAASTKDTFEDVRFTQSMNRRLGHPSVAELSYAKQILEMTDTEKIQQPARLTSLQVAGAMNASGGTVTPKGNKFSLIKDLMPPSGPGDLIFKDILVEIRRIYKTDSRMSIYVTDYTSHKLLYDYKYDLDDEAPDGDAFGYVAGASRTWPGPHGRLTMHITLWDANARFGHRELQEGNYVLLKNVHVKMDKNGMILEGHCRGNRMNTTQVNITVVKAVEIDGNEQLRDLVRRKRGVHKAEGSKFASDPTNLKREAEAIAADTVQPAQTSKQARNKKMRDKKKQKGKAKGTDVMEDSDETGPISESKAASRFLTNSDVRIVKCAVPPKPIHEIVDREILARFTPNGNPFYLPFQNCKYKSHVRVVDFFPNNIADFAAPYRSSDYGMLLDEESDEEDEIDVSQLDDTDIKWEWRFILLVEDAVRPPGQQAARMELLVSGTDGEYLLDMEACNLRKNSQKLTELKEKLFILWGDLQELKAEAGEEVTEFKPKARPFECLIKEYGIEVRDEEGEKIGDDDYERVFRLWGITIK